MLIILEDHLTNELIHGWDVVEGGFVYVMDCGKLIAGANDRVNEEDITIVLSKHDLAAGGATECSVCRVGGATEGDTVVDEFVEGDGARIGVLDHEVRQETAERDSGTPIGVDATKITMVVTAR
ncbi:hypothetical protein B296_00028488 [Ensete ventricosum]|uniref:Uncharacterized protein n=1 Tax=Ensete ventricosum TaxID=4639 RepID=A0A427AKD7_ENSVE|nr:hypothetical protein B296_00028488 [Ensete ventricosum]